jgi:hypothetical protein
VKEEKFGFTITDFGFGFGCGRVKGRNRVYLCDFGTKSIQIKA